jgi:elongator complex protein 4
MSSFKRKNATTETQEFLKGTKSSPALASLILTSSGIPSFDDVLGGGIQLATSVAVLNPDPHSAHTDLLQKYFIAQGIASGHLVHVFDPSGRSFVDSCMWTSVSDTIVKAGVGPEDEEAGEDDIKVKIAWRYEKMQKFKTTVSSNRDEEYVSLPCMFGLLPKLMCREEYCRSFDLTQQIPSELVEALLQSGDLVIEDSAFETTGDVWDSVIQRIIHVLQKCVYMLYATTQHQLMLVLEMRTRRSAYVFVYLHSQVLGGAIQLQKCVSSDVQTLYPSHPHFRVSSAFSYGSDFSYEVALQPAH